MEKKYYLDTSIWIDAYHDRRGYAGEPLGYFAEKLLLSIRKKGDALVISDILIKELERRYSMAEINGMIKPFEDLLIKSISTTAQKDEAKQLARERNVPFGDALHAIIARDKGFTLITRDNDFRRLTDITPYYKPEEVI